MPLRSSILAAWYVQLAQQLEAGLTLRDALTFPSAHRRLTAVAAEMAAVIDRGGSVDDALRGAEGVLPPSDILTLSAAAEVGRMPSVLRNLAGRHERLAAARTRLALACAYPLAVVHLGLLLLPIARMIDWEKGFQWNPLLYVQTVLWYAVPLWVGLGALYFAVQRGNRVMRALAMYLPGIGGYLRAQALSDLAFTLGNFVAAGVTIGDAWAAAALVSSAPELKRAGEALSAAVARGQAPGPQLAAWRCLPPDFVAQYRSGESTGQLDVALQRIGEQQQDAASRALLLTTLLYPALVFLALAVSVASMVLSVYSGYLRTLTRLAE